MLTQADKDKALAAIVDSDKRAFFKKIGYYPIPKLIHFHNNVELAKVICTLGGNRSSKTTAMVAEVCYQMVVKNRSVWIVAVDYSKTHRFIFGKDAALGVKDYVGASEFGFMVSSINQKDHYIILKNGKRIEGKSFKYADSFIAEPVDIIVIEDADTVTENFYLKYIRPRITDTKGRIWLNGLMPIRKTWLVDIWAKHFPAEKQTANRYSYQVSMYDNPNLDPEEIKELEQDLPPHLKRAIVFGLPPERDSSIFGNLSNAFCLQRQAFNQQHLYRAGIDIGRTNDRTVLTISDLTDKCMAFIDVFPPSYFHTESVEQRILQDLSQYGNPMTNLDVTGWGQQFEFMTRKYHWILPYMIQTLKERNKLFDCVSLAIERGYRMIDNPYVKAEFEHQNMERRTGYIHYFPESGYHDDCPISVGLSIIDWIHKFDNVVSAMPEPVVIEHVITDIEREESIFGNDNLEPVSFTGRDGMI
jgi:hypothetical protein